jgi:hypothetical protein
MINHARSLILNDVASNRPEAGTLGEEYLPTEYRMLDYSGTLDRVRTKLLGASNDPLYQNYRLAQLMAVMHGNQYAEEQALALDTRYTYRPYKADFLNLDFAVEVSEVDDKNMTLKTTGVPTANAAIGKSLYRWNVRTAVGPELIVQELLTGQTATYNVTITDEVTNSITLENGVILTVEVPSDIWQVEAMWVVTSMARPDQDLGYLVADLNSLGTGTVTDLFRNVPSSFYNLWYQGVSLVDQLGGLLGAFVYKAEEVRQNE